MDNATLLVYAVLIVLFVSFPAECMDWVLWVSVWLKAHVMNIVLFVKSYFMYRALRRDLAKIGVAIPPFRFTPVWERD